jgi:predicted dehydrogenase
MKPHQFPRRSFMAALGATATSGAVLAPKHLWAQSANDRLNVGCIGVGGMGKGDLQDHKNKANIVAVCDVDAVHLEEARMNPELGDGKPDAYSDYRKVLDRDDIDIVSIVTPDHWHVKIAIEALKAGKHVFCQKPLTLTLEENLLIREAAASHPDLVFSIGTQQRSDKNLFLRAVNMVQKGLLGDIQRITCGIDGGSVGGPFPKTTAPERLDWEMWLGQAPKVDYIQQRSHGNFRWWYEYSGGKFTDWGAHHLDIALWSLGLTEKGTGPISIDGSDAHHPVKFEEGMPVVDDAFNTADDFAVQCQLSNGVEMVVSSRSDNGLLFEGSKGRIFVNRQRITGTPIEEEWDKDQYTDEDTTRLYKGKPQEWHKNNFYRCIREGGEPLSDVNSHVQTMHACHLVAIAARLGRTIQWDPKAEKIVGDEQAESMFARPQRDGYEIG